ncbi:hypothetical protein [Corallococcus sp. Z5C101001]|uniref:ligand-binding sensor domain-containing protein n=1 Tax=Corallococcus sp. Z5C101001 TaxID=2596829 RepID=UPI00117E10A6|nr:hypothetical protein [Corallococcus sp. Z5C101001]TSC27559.1 hypothetical protein FOF48_19250 [Corallococcus sp. Z5C101001]
MMLSTLTALALAATVTNTEAVHDLEPFGGHVVACTEGGLELFTPAGRAVRVLTVEDGLPSHFCRALESTGDRLFVATDEGLVSLDTGFRVTPVLDVRWQALPPAEDASTPDYVSRLESLAAVLTPGATYTAFSPRFAGTAEGRLFELGTSRAWSLPGPVRFISDTLDGVDVGTSEGAFSIDSRGRLSAVGNVPTGPLSFTVTEQGVRIVGSTGDVRAWGAPGSAEALRVPEGIAVPSAGATSAHAGTAAPGAGATSAPASTAAPGAGATSAPASTAMPRATHAGPVENAAVPAGATVLKADWAGTRASGVFLREKKGWRRVTPTGQLCGNHITALARHQGRLVVGTFDRGVCWQLEDGRWRTTRAPSLPSDQVLGLTSDGQNLYVATTYGLGLHDGKSWSRLSYGARNPVALAKLSVLGVSQMEGGMALVDGRGVSLVTPDGSPLSLVKRLPLPEGWSKHASVGEGAGRFLWMGSEDRGLLRWNGERWQRFHDGRDLTDNWITTLSTDAEGRAIAGTCQDGFNYFDGAKWTRVRAAPGLPSSAIVSTALVPGGALVGTLLGASYFDAGTGEVRALPGLADPRVYAVLPEGDSALFGTEGGLSTMAWRPAPALSRR